MFNSETAQKKWAPLLDHGDAAPINDSYRRAVTAVLLENQEKAMKEERAQSGFQLNESDTVSGDSRNFDPVLIALVRRAMPSLIAYDIAGVQPMSGPTGLIFSMRSVYKDTTTSGTGGGATRSVVSGQEALFDTPNRSFSGDSPSGQGLATATGETLTDGVADDNDGRKNLRAMGFTIDKLTVTAKTRALKAGYTMELAQDLKAIHGLDAEAELANILSTEILAEINREVIDEIRSEAFTAATSTVDLTGTGTDVLGARWGQERFQALSFRIEQTAQEIAQKTRRGKGNFVIVSPQVGAALAASGYMQYGDAIEKSGLNIDAQVNTFAGTLNGSTKVYVDPYLNTTDAATQVIVGYRGASPYDAGMFYCPYVPLTMVKAVGETDFQPRIAFKTRYGLASNPYMLSYTNGVKSDGSLATTNNYFAKMTVTL